MYSTRYHLFIFTTNALFYNDLQHKEFEDNKEVIRIRRSKRDRQHNDQRIKGQKDKLWSTKHYA
jgi:hypothetical protein